jgi:hypothetical protein
MARSSILLEGRAQEALAAMPVIQAIGAYRLCDRPGRAQFFSFPQAVASVDAIFAAQFHCSRDRRAVGKKFASHDR